MAHSQTHSLVIAGEARRAGNGLKPNRHYLLLMPWRSLCWC